MAIPIRHREKPRHGVRMAKTKRYTVVITSDFKWSENSPKYLGIIEELGIAWAWYENGRSIDSADPGFDLVDFSPPPPPPDWLDWIGGAA